MSRRNTYFTILAVALILIGIGFIVPVPFIKGAFNTTLKLLCSPYIFAPAAVCAFLFMNNRNYWYLNLGCAAITALLIQFFITKGGFNIEIFAYRILAFMVVVYILNLIKVILNK